MKCPECSRNHKHSAGMTCGCGYRFAVDPKTHGLSDNKILAIAKRASGNNTNFYTMNQLLSAGRDRFSIGARIGFGIVGSLILVFGTMIFSDAGWFLLIPIGLGLALLAIAVFTPSTSLGVAKDPKKFKRALSKYENAKGKLTHLLRDDKPLADAPPAVLESDIYDYGVEAILICERDVIVDLLVLNQWHSENRTLVVGESGYPEYLIDRVNNVLAEQPDVPVFILHDATAAGEQMLERVRATGRYAIGQHKVVDLGISRDDVKRSAMMKRFAQKDGTVEIDYAGWTSLAPILVAGIAGQMALAQVMAAQKGDSGGDSSMSFG